MPRPLPITVQRRLLKAFEDACRRAGLRLTHQRLEIYRELVTAIDHPSAETLHRRLLRKIPTLSLDTVYRTLATFAAHGLIHKVETAQSRGRYEVQLSPHHHLICRRCDEILDFEWGGLDGMVLPEALRDWGTIECANVIVYGVCRNCLKQQELKPNRSAPS